MNILAKLSSILKRPRVKTEYIYMLKTVNKGQQGVKQGRKAILKLKSGNCIIIQHVEGATGYMVNGEMAKILSIK